MTRSMLATKPVVTLRIASICKLPIAFRNEISMLASDSSLYFYTAKS